MRLDEAGRGLVRLGDTVEAGCGVMRLGEVL